MVRGLFILMLLFTLQLEARGGRRVGGGNVHPAEMAHPAAAANRPAVRPLQRTPALSRAALNAAGLEAIGAGAVGGAGYEDDNQQPIEIQLSPSPNTNSSQ